MTAKEKALEIYNKMHNSVCDVEARDGGGWDNCTLTEQSTKLAAKQCALIAVDEILELIEMAFVNEFIRMGAKSYWIEVKTEIQKL